MTPEGQRIAIAEACGWKHFKQGHKVLLGWQTNNKDVQAQYVPDYLNDLNAMHEAEKALTPEQGHMYALVLEELICPDFLADTDCDPDNILFADIHSTAAQRAEAFLRTLGLWKE